MVMLHQNNRFIIHILLSGFMCYLLPSLAETGTVYQLHLKIPCLCKMTGKSILINIYGSYK